MVGYADGIGPGIVHDPLKIGVTQFTGGHLYGYSVLCCVCLGVVTADNQFDSGLFAQLCYELLVTVTLGTAQVEVAVDSRAAVTEAEQYHEQGGTVGTSAQAHDYVCAVLQ